ncbi:MAG: glycosyltransferase family 2 protein [Planctomycetes bacterium]|nr:glycosyltransferase family 2 protein [Planctomycetota bacterium]
MNDQPDTVSVVIPAYNIEDYITRAINSALAQTYPPHEIIVTDDGSTDRTAERIKQFGSKVRYIYQDNAGPSAARNTAIKVATGRWIALLDGDDEWLPEKLELQIELLRKYPDLVWADCNLYMKQHGSNTKTFCNDPQLVEKYLDGKECFDSYFTAANAGILMTECSILIKRDVFDQVGLYQEGLHYAEDIDMYWRIAYRWPKIGYVRKSLAIYHFARPGSLTNATPEIKILNTICDLFQHHLDLSKQHGCQPQITPYIAQKLRKWIYIAYRRGQFDIAKKTIKQFRDILPVIYRFVYGFCLNLPRPAIRINKLLLKWIGYHQ